jgi:hypothetical protein
MARAFVFIKPDARFFIFHGSQQRFGLALTHLALFLCFGVGRLRCFVRRLFRFLARRAFDFAR